MKKCLNCGEPLASHRHRFCSAECRTAFRCPPKNQRPPACPLCGKPVFPPQRDYCSHACGVEMHRRKWWEAHRPQVRHSPEQKLRVCLRCETEFMSDHPGNRICPKCWNSEADMPTVRVARFGGQSRIDVTDRVGNFLPRE